MIAKSMQNNMQLSFQRYKTLVNQTLQWGVFIYQAIAIVLFFLGLFLASRWLSLPFLGALYEHTLVFNGTGPSEAVPAWALFEQVSVGDQLISINGISVKSSKDIRAILQDRFAGEDVEVTVLSVSGEKRVLMVTLQNFPSESRTVYFVIPTILSVVFLAASLWIFGLRRNEPAGRAFSLFTSSLAIITGTYFDLITTHQFTVIWTAAAAISAGALVDLAFTFPLELRFAINRPYLRWVGLEVGIILFFVAYVTLFNFDQPTAYISRWQYIYGFIAFSAVLYISTNLYHAIYAQSPVVKTQSRTILIGTLFAFVPLVIWLGLGAFQPINFSPYLFLPLAFFPLVIGYTIMRFRFLRADDVARRGLMYVLLSVLVVGGYALPLLGLSLIFNSSLPANNAYFVGGFILLLVILLEPIRTKLQNLVDSLFFRGERAYAEQLQDFSHKLTSALDLHTIGVILRQQIASTLTPSRIHIYTYDTLNDFFSALPGDDRRPTSDIRFTATSPFARYFESEHLPLYLDSTDALPLSLQAEQSRLALLGARLFIGLPGKQRVNGWLALGPRLSGQPYTPRDLQFLENICDQSSIAIERLQTVAHLERQIQEMNALTRVSQGVNVTLTFDDVLELIYAQTAQIIPTSHFHITLYDEISDYYYYGFCVENNERIPERENLPFLVSTGLSPEVIRKSRQLMTQDYIRECQARNLTPILENVFAWMGVPLNAGAQSIGALSIGSRDGATAYTRGQLGLLQAIADQTAGAIVKARLLQETEQRARQLSTLNEITRQLTSTLELDPLLQNILENAVGILNCEAGSLLLVDEQTKELVFKVTVGPVAANLIGQRLPSGTGIVGRAVQTRRPIIENEEQRAASKRFNGVDQQTGFVSRSLMAVPLQVKDHVTGVVEVINRRDGLPFVAGDQELLTAFAGQAAVAIENTRLFMLTDQELAARVEELSVMQRIDRELNASLEMDRAMRITLDWALRQSDAEAGLIGMLEDGNLHVMAHQGLDERMANLPDQTMKVELPAMLASVANSQPQFLTVTASNEKLLSNAHTQMIIPIRRETLVIGLLHLESTSDSQVDIDFLTRLTDHAAIAISNAQLFGEVQRANVAKSDFVSFVAHELKNPMTSIKGYTELLAGGAVGQINEMQTNFLTTIKSNVERMSTLVSDLNDNAKIEAGRLRLEYKATSAPDLVDEVSRSLKRQIEDKKQTLEIILPAKISNMWADRIRVGQVLTNLVSNAYKYTPEGGVIQLGVEEVANQWDEQGAARVVHLWVKDNGIGLTPEDQQKMFQKFFRSDDPKAREAPGTGLGLNITKGLVEMQGGKIWFESEYRKGTNFHFTVPVAEE
jgi:signal transduction histidine kinase